MRYAVLAGIDHLLRVLHTNAHGKSFCFHIDPPIFHQGKGISGAVPHRHDKNRSGNPGFVIDLDFLNFLIFYEQIGNLTIKMESSPHIFNLFSEIGDNLNQQIRSQVGFVIVQNFSGSASLHKKLQYFPISSLRIFHGSI